MASIREVLAKNLKENRARLGLTQAELAEKAGISTTYVAKIELKQQFPAPDTLDKIAKALHIEVTALFNTPASPAAALEKVQNTVIAKIDTAIDSIERTVDEAVQKAIAKNLKMLAGKQRKEKK